MSDSINLTIDVKGIDEALERNRAIARGISEADFKGVSRMTKFLERRVKENLRAGRHGIKSKRTLRQSFTSAAFVAGKKVVGVVGSALVYARIHELGGKIVPKTAGALTIPMGRLKKTHAQASDFPDAFILRIQGKGAFLVQRKSEHLEFLFALKRKVFIRGKHYLERTFREETAKGDQMVNFINKEIIGLVRGTGTTP